MKKCHKSLKIIIVCMKFLYFLECQVEVDLEDGDFKSFLFFTKEMQEIFKRFSEILFIDATYKLLNLALAVVILLIEDGDGRSEVVAVGLLNSEDEASYHWFLQTIKKHNQEACEKVQVIMSDKDMKERIALSKVFPGVPLHICRFHTMQIFKRKFSSCKINHNDTQKCLEILQKLIYSYSEQNYLKNYEKFRVVAPKEIVTYFDTYWHNLRREWTDYGMTLKNLGNLTNNRLESLNAKLKAIIKKMNSLMDFLIKFFKWVQSNCFEVLCRLNKTFLEKEIHLNVDENMKVLVALTKYEDYLAFYPYNLVVEKMKFLDAVSFTEIDQITQTCKIQFKEDTLSCTIFKCDCAFWLRHELPCAHILNARNVLDFNLFDTSICNQRWTKGYVLESRESIMASDEVAEWSFSNTTPTVSRRVSKKPLTVPEKRKRITPIINDIVTTVSNSCGQEFENNYNFFKKLSECMSVNNDLLMQLLNEALLNFNQSESLTSAPFSSSAPEDDLLGGIKMVKPIRIKGRPSRFLDTTPSKKVIIKKKAPKKKKPIKEN